MRSFTAGASGTLRIEPTVNGGRGRLTVARLPHPSSVTAAADTYMAWAVGEGRFVRLGELEVDGRGNGSFDFVHPAPLARYTVLVTAEATTLVEHPAGAPILSTRANEAMALFVTPSSSSGEAAGANNDPANNPVRPPEMVRNPETEKFTRPRRSNREGDFYDQVNDALEASGGGRLLIFMGTEAAPNAHGNARVTTREGSAFVRMRFYEMPLPGAIGANTYILWSSQPGGRIVYMGSLPTSKEINLTDIYVRVAGFLTDDFSLFVTAESQRPVAQPSDRRLLATPFINYSTK